MLRAAALPGLADESRLAVLARDVDGVAFGGEAERRNLDLLAAVPIEVLRLELENRAPAEFAAVRVEAPERLDQRLSYLLVAEGEDGFASVGELPWAAGTGDEATGFGGDGEEAVGVACGVLAALAVE